MATKSTKEEQGRAADLAKLKRSAARTKAREERKAALFACNVCSKPCVHLEPEPRCKDHVWWSLRPENQGQQ